VQQRLGGRLALSLKVQEALRQHSRAPEWWRTAASETSPSPTRSLTYAHVTLAFPLEIG
jgi:hypothetical protein